MTLPEYITATRSTDLVGTVKHAALGLISEVGEVYGVLAKIERGDSIDRTERMTGELGDVAWFLARLCDLYSPGYDLRFDDPHYRWLHRGLTYQAYTFGLTECGHCVLLDGQALTVDQQMNLWHQWAAICQIEGLDPLTVLESNLAKLRDRAARKVLQGDGDHR